MRQRRRWVGANLEESLAQGVGHDVFVEGEGRGAQVLVLAEDADGLGDGESVSRRCGRCR